MKNTILVSALALCIFASCKKEEQIEPDAPAVQPETAAAVHSTTDTIPVPPLALYDTTWRLSMQVPSQNIDFDVPVSDGGILMDSLDRPCGSELKFVSDSADVSLCVLYDGTITQFHGDIHGHSFILYNGMINICGGAQHVSVNYRLYKQGI